MRDFEMHDYDVDPSEEFDAASDDEFGAGFMWLLITSEGNWLLHSSRPI